MQNHRLFRWDFNLVMSFFCAEFRLMTKLRERIAEYLRLTTSGIDVVLRHDAPDFFSADHHFKDTKSPTTRIALCLWNNCLVARYNTNGPIRHVELRYCLQKSAGCNG